MVGFIKGFFRSKAKSQESQQADTSAAPAQPSKNQAYFLDADSAQTFGDVEYMRTTKAVRRTFPKTLVNPEGFERIKQTSSVEQLKALKEIAASNLSPEAVSKIEAAIQSDLLQQAESKKRRSADTSMDMFRNMARDLKKPK